ncbi:hypothetical protein ALDI51_27490 [Alicycliphilus denitrificans]|nr:hypothetical protein ALDI51_27490 [Alicycliphilus denitrificans]
MHEGCALARMPKSRLEFWRPKLEGNRVRDALKLEQLRALGWDVMVVWECELRELDELVTRIEAFLNDDKGTT